VNRRPIRVQFVVADLRFGGAQRHQTTLLPRMDPARFTRSDMCIGEEGGLFADLPAVVIEAAALHMSGKRHARSAPHAAHLLGMPPAQPPFGERVRYLIAAATRTGDGSPIRTGGEAC
jgi:hypothetical protein